MSSTAGVRDDSVRGVVGLADLRRHSVERLMEALDFPRSHAEQVRYLADRLSDLLAGELLLSAEGRMILHYAAMLHDVGWHFGGTRHHRRAYELIRAGDLSGFTSNQIEQIALVARYHRKTEPKLRHPEFARLNPLDRQQVTKLAGILRVADGLDRSHRSAVQDVGVRLGEGQVELILTSRGGDLALEIWAVRRKKRLLETVLGRRLTLGVRPAADKREDRSC